MYSGFPVELIPLMRCKHDSGSLRIDGDVAIDNGRIMSGSLKCESCGKLYPIERGIVRMLDKDQLVAESENERIKRDIQGVEPLDVPDYDEYAISTKLKMLAPMGGACFEMGCGTGRLTRLIADKFQVVLSLDLSFQALSTLAAHLDARVNIGLVEADIGSFSIAPNSFDRCLSTLVSNLPTREIRMAMFRVAADSLKSDGKFVYAVHHHCLRSRWKKYPKEGHYAANGIYRLNFYRKEILDEAKQFFKSSWLRTRAIYMPSFLGRLGKISYFLAWLSERLPVTNLLSELLIIASERPIKASTSSSLPKS